jgi:twitching motility protein PilT
MAKMDGQYSDEPLDGLLRVLVELGGDRLNLQTDADPLAFQGERKLRLTLPTTSNATLQTLCGAMAQAHTTKRSTLPSTFAYTCKGTGLFVVDIEGSFAPDEVARLHIRRLPAEPVVVAAVNPAAQQPPTSAPVSTTTTTHVPARGVDWTDDNVLPVLLRQALDNHATDLHLTDGEPAVLRAAGRLNRVGDSFRGVASLLDAAQLATVQAGHAVDLGLTFESRARLRVNVFKAESGLCAAIRFLPLEPPELASLGLPPEVLSQLSDVPNGLVLICGHTGSGKSTTLASLLHHRTSLRARHLITLESPIEYLIPGGRSLVRQREVGIHVATFASGLRDALREDPDELMIGEMRDAETIGLALTAAETGHLVWSSLHSRTARSAIERIVDQVPANAQRQVRGQLADSLRVVICQRLVAPDPDAYDTHGQCVVAAEVMVVNSAVAHLIREGKTEQLGVVIHSGKDAGMLPLEKDLARLVQKGRITRSAARSEVTDTALFERYAGA